jgi:poly-gamma-glutamate capsule biosynthesis protein CapA/YwtB (metallophosphatase superfamily)
MFPRKRYRLLILISCLILLQLSACQQQPAPPPSKEKSSRPPSVKTEIIIAAVGDVMMPESIQSVVVKDRRGYDLLFEKIIPDLSAADITFANLETSVDHKAGVSGYPKFNARPELLASLKKAGVDIVSVANNHAMDTGSDGLKRTLDNIEASGLVFIGAGRTKAEAAMTRFLKTRGVTVAFLAYTYATNQRLPRRSPDAPGVNIIGNESETDLTRAAASVRQARAGADLVVVSLHWGYEYATSPTAWQRRVSSELIEAGADVILGHHPHVLQPIESYIARDNRMGLIVYSLGNFISRQNADVSYENKTHQKALRGDGIILSITATKEGDRTQVAHAEFLPIWSLCEPIGEATVYRPVSLARELSMLGAKKERVSTEEKLMRFLSYRQEYIIRRLTGTPE